MPGFNQRGPMNEGPMTGRRQGDCTSKNTHNDSQSRFGTMGYGRGRGCGMGRRSGQQNGGQGRGYGRMNADDAFVESDESLNRRVQTLEAKLNDIKNELTKLSTE